MGAGGSRWDKLAGDTTSQFSASESGSQFTLNESAAAKNPLQAILDERNRPLCDDELDKILPSSGYEVSIVLPATFLSDLIN